MRASLGQRDTPTGWQLDDELTNSTAATFMVRSRIKDTDLSYFLTISLNLWCLGLPALQNGLTTHLRVLLPFMSQRCSKAFTYHYGSDVLVVEGCQGWSCGKPPIPKRDQDTLRLKWNKVRTLDSNIRSLSNLLNDHDLLICFGLMVAFRFKGVPLFRLVRGVGELSTSAQPLSQEKRKATEVGEGLLSTRRARQTEKDRSFSSIFKERGTDAGNSSSSSGKLHRVRIYSRYQELDAHLLEMLPTLPAIAAVSVYKYWTLGWEKAVKKTSIDELLQMVEMSIARGLILNEEMYNTIAGFDGKLSKEEAKSKKLFKDLKVMSLEKA
ncbi:hypothetical protein Adt_05696 [Abeliophyllum distichum]|uniref:Uncharacterized protein n=1 Tax=Abeliophyllum distichum TaxID=126358 RepID=A0ABD1V4U0_9LAMI